MNRADADNSTRLINASTYAALLRSKSIMLPDRFLITNFRNSLQEKDISEGVNCDGFGRIHHFRSNNNPLWTPNPLPQEVAAWKLRTAASEVERTQVFQNASCNMRCWYCFVDFDLLAALSKKSAFLSADDILALLLREENRARVVDLSGGQPDIIPEWPVRFLEAILRRNLQDEFFVWMDDNLSLDYAWQYLTEADFRILQDYPNFARVGCFKGFSQESFQENTCVTGKMLKVQLNLMSRWIQTGIDMYGYITLTTSNLTGMRDSLSSFMDDVQRTLGHYFLLRTIPLEVLPFTPTTARLSASRQAALRNQYEVLSAWKDELERRYSSRERRRRIYEIPCGEAQKEV